MKKYYIIQFIILIILIFLYGCKKDNKIEKTDYKITDIESKVDNYLVTFIELGSINCVPCKMMQPIMKQVEEKFDGQVKVIFYDVWTQKDASMSQKYGIRVIPTQIFLDSNGNEYFRHEGYFPFEELEKILKQKGVK
ncbi:MAG: thioredoxin [Spirochaetes bacterium GWD1_27_9]|nr:MAG: thioredoxin [Spirochaetes bacterium GWB1_27_13]OHD36104.1 MAG: thioredoxin [Spirochaetes bacterium GWD1_27_9]